MFLLIKMNIKNQNSKFYFNIRAEIENIIFNIA